MTTIAVARLLRPRGNKGELLADSLGAPPDRFSRLHTVTVNGRPLEVQRAWFHDGRLVLKFSGVDSIAAAQCLAGADVLIPASERAPLEEGAFYLADLIGCEVFDRLSGQRLACVTGWVESAPSAPILLETQTPEGAELLIPFARSICTSINPAARRIEVDLPEGLRALNSPTGS
jgi:16S rRNA processing protein RimM